MAEQQGHQAGLFIIAGMIGWSSSVESFYKGELGDDLFDRDWFRTLAEAKGLIEPWRRRYNERRLHSAWAAGRLKRYSPKFETDEFIVGHDA